MVDKDFGDTFAVKLLLVLICLVLIAMAISALYLCYLRIKDKQKWKSLMAKFRFWKRSNSVAVKEAPPSARGLLPEITIAGDPVRVSKFKVIDMQNNKRIVLVVDVDELKPSQFPPEESPRLQEELPNQSQQRQQPRRRASRNRPQEPSLPIAPEEPVRSMAQEIPVEFPPQAPPQKDNLLQIPQQAPEAAPEIAPEATIATYPKLEHSQTIMGKTAKYNPQDAYQTAKLSVMCEEEEPPAPTEYQFDGPEAGNHNYFENPQFNKVQKGQMIEPPAASNANPMSIQAAPRPSLELLPCKQSSRSRSKVSTHREEEKKDSSKKEPSSILKKKGVNLKEIRSQIEMPYFEKQEFVQNIKEGQVRSTTETSVVIEKRPSQPQQEEDEYEYEYCYYSEEY